MVLGLRQMPELQGGHMVFCREYGIMDSWTTKSKNTEAAEDKEIKTMKR